MGNKETHKEKLNDKFQNAAIRKKPPVWFYLVLTILPFLLMFSAEISLRFFNYGETYMEWVSIDDNYEILSPNIAKKYFNGVNNIPFSTESFLLKQKPQNSFRIIVLGASSGAGYPYQNSGSFSKYLRKSLELTYPAKMVEVANISMAAINSYTILDLLSGVISKKPDLIIIYLGHNEYYGVLGAGSNYSLGNNRLITNLSLKFKNFKLYQMLEDLFFYVRSLMSKNISAEGTLMSRIAGDKLIELNSEIYEKGAEQFKGNLIDIFDLCKRNNIPVIIGTLTSNLKDLMPFQSLEDSKYQSAQSVFVEGTRNYERSNFSKADSLFRLAKDLDVLRFRAPELFNETIKSLAVVNGIIVANIDSVINQNSHNFIVGNEYMVDHLHPNLVGYQIMGKLFYDKIIENEFMNNPNSSYTGSEIDSLVKDNYNFTKYDSTIAEFRIKILKNDWPFLISNEQVKKKQLLNPNTFEGNKAYEVLEGKLSRLEARLKIAAFYLKQENYSLYSKELIAMVEEFPTHKFILNEESEKLIKSENYKHVGKLLEASYKYAPDIFNTKWLGIMSMANNNIKYAIKYLEEANKLNSNDPQVLFNLAGAYFQKKDYNTSYIYIIECLRVKYDYKNGEELKSQLEKILNY